MPKIEISTEIYAPIEICFDLSRSIDLHRISTLKTNEKAIYGVTSGLINLNETATWEATHFGFRQHLTSKITACNRPYSFVDEQTKGIFKSIFHLHEFQEINGKVIMKDTFEFSSPYGILGRLFNFLVLTNYLKNLLMKRNQVIKNYAETEKWKTVLAEKNYL
ncbi:hypothetical protein D3C87_107960 [compost metagenome]